MTAPLDRRALLWRVGVFALATIAAAILAPLVGPTPMALGRALSHAGADRLVLVHARLPRIAAALVGGAGLAAAGVALQSLLRNALAEPYTLGVSGGGALAAAMSIALGLDSLLPRGLAVPASSLAGTFAVAWLVARLGRGDGRRLSPPLLLLTGISISVVCSAGILLALHVAEPLTGARVLRWLMGGLDIAGFDLLAIATPLVAIGVAGIVASARAMNALALGDDAAAALGVDVERTGRRLYFCASLATGAVVAVVGPIGFVGLVVPHALRRIVGSDHRVLLPCSILAGGLFLLLCDTVTRVAFRFGEPPVGILTALVGGPTLVALLLRDRPLRGDRVQG
jgi:iron complex transport system permease protein